jgi:hypothetical protein
MLFAREWFSSEYILRLTSARDSDFFPTAVRPYLSDVIALSRASAAPLDILFEADQRRQFAVCDVNALQRAHIQAPSSVHSRTKGCDWVLEFFGGFPLIRRVISLNWGLFRTRLNRFTIKNGDGTVMYWNL